MKITSALRWQLNDLCHYYSDTRVPPVEVREHMYRVVKKETGGNWQHDQMEQVVEGFMTFWDLA